MFLVRKPRQWYGLTPYSLPFGRNDGMCILSDTKNKLTM